MAVAVGAVPVAKRCRLRSKTSPFYTELLAQLGREDHDMNQRVYLATISRVLPGGTSHHYRDLERISKVEVADAPRAAFDNPLPMPSCGGAPRSHTDPRVDSVIVVEERHADGSKHFHIVTKLHRMTRFKKAKEVLRVRHG